jgi:hypothetical protein
MRWVVMRGDLSDALDRLARRDEALRRRGEPEDPRSAAEDLVAAARRLVDRHPELSVTVTVESGQSQSSVRLVHGQPPVVLESPVTEPPPADAPTAGVRPLELGADEVVVLDAPHPPTAASRLAELLREYPLD